MSKTLILQVICAFLLTPVRINCEIWNSYKTRALYKDKLCSAKFILNELFASKLLHCVTSCRHMDDCSAVIFHRKNKTCYTLRSGFQHDDCSFELIGAKLYDKDPCPVDWIFLHRSCYRITNEEQDQASSAATCKGFQKHAHLVDIISGAEQDQVHQWLNNTYSNYKAGPYFWIGATYTTNGGWIWSDGRKITDKLWYIPDLSEGKMCSNLINGLFHIKECDGKLRGICEINIIIQ